MATSQMLNTTIGTDEYLQSHSYIITIDGYEYTAITERSYSIETDSPSRIVQTGFDYSGHSNIRPMEVSYTIVVSKIDQNELLKLMDLFQQQTIFEMITPVHNIDHCIISAISVNDNSLDFLTLNVTFQELNSSVSYASTTAVSSFQLYAGGGGTSACSINASTSDYCNSNIKADTTNYESVMSTELVDAAALANAEDLPFRGANTKSKRVIYANDTATVTTTEELETEIEEETTETSTSVKINEYADALRSAGWCVPDEYGTK